MTSKLTVNERQPRRRPYPWRCMSCLKEEVRPASINYLAEIVHDGRRHQFEVPEVTVLQCAACGNRAFDNDADDQILTALRKHLNLLMPKEIANARQGLNIAIPELAERLGVAEKALAQWENGEVVQPRAMDNLLRMYFSVPEARAVLQPSAAGTEQPVERQTLIP